MWAHENMWEHTGTNFTACNQVSHVCGQPAGKGSAPSMQARCELSSMELSETDSRTTIAATTAAAVCIQLQREQ